MVMLNNGITHLELTSELFYEHILNGFRIRNFSVVGFYSGSCQRSRTARSCELEQRNEFLVLLCTARDKGDFKSE